MGTRMAPSKRRCRSTAAVDVTGAARSRRSHVVLLSTLTSMGEVVAAVVLARRSVIPTQFLVPPFPVPPTKLDSVRDRAALDEAFSWMRSRAPTTVMFAGLVWWLTV